MLGTWEWHHPEQLVALFHGSEFTPVASSLKHSLPRAAESLCLKHYPNVPWLWLAFDYQTRKNGSVIVYHHFRPPLKQRTNPVMLNTLFFP